LSLVERKKDHQAGKSRRSTVDARKPPRYVKEEHHNEYYNDKERRWW